MPPIRKQKKKPRGISALPELGSTRDIGLEAHERATATNEPRTTQSTGEATTCLTSEVEEARLVDEGTATPAIGESDEACEIAPTQAEVAAKKTSMPTNPGLEEVTFRYEPQWKSNHLEWLGYKTKKVVFSCNFVLKEYVTSHNISHSRVRTRTDCQLASISTS